MGRERLRHLIFPVSVPCSFSFDFSKNPVCAGTALGPPGTPRSREGRCWVGQQMVRFLLNMPILLFGSLSLTKTLAPTPHTQTSLPPLGTAKTRLANPGCRMARSHPQRPVLVSRKRPPSERPWYEGTVPVFRSARPAAGVVCPRVPGRRPRNVIADLTHSDGLDSEPLGSRSPSLSGAACSVTSEKPHRFSGLRGHLLLKGGSSSEFSPHSVFLFSSPRPGGFP